MNRAIYNVDDSQTTGGNGTGSPPAGVGPLSLQLSTLPQNSIPKSMGLVVKGVGAAANAWSAVLEGSLDGTNWTTILTHSSGDGTIVWTGAGLYFPVNYLRTRLASVTLGSASAVVVSAIGV